MAKAKKKKSKKPAKKAAKKAPAKKKKATKAAARKPARKTAKKAVKKAAKKSVKKAAKKAPKKAAKKAPRKTAPKAAPPAPPPAAEAATYSQPAMDSPGPLFNTEAETDDIDAAPATFPRVAGNRLSASYVNAYVASGTVVVPLLDPALDDEALAVYGELFPEREIVGVAAREILLGGGNIHCITQQVPEPLQAG